MATNTKATKAQLIDEATRLRAHSDWQERRIAELEAEVAALRNKVAKQTPVAAPAPAPTTAPDSELADLARRCGINVAPGRSAPKRPAPKVGDIVSTYTKADGSRWNKVCDGFNRYVHRPA